jgi:coenzyme F420-0:L-glutamate ligase/coenzyme F420-1:gamma-L-glutamate ligase
MTLQIIPVEGIGEVDTATVLDAVILAAINKTDERLQDGDVLVITHKIVSKAEGAIRTGIETDADYRQLVESEAARVIRRRGDLVITETRHGFVCANAGVDRSNAVEGTAVLLPVDSDRSAHRLRLQLEQTTGVSIGVIISDTFGRAWRRGVVDFAIGISGVPAIVDHRGEADMFGRVMEATEVGLADEIAAAADLVMGKASGIPVAIVRGLATGGPPGRGSDLVRPPNEDMFR